MKHEEYLKKLAKVREPHDIARRQYYQARDEKLATEEQQLRRQEEEAAKAIRKCK